MFAVSSYIKFCVYLCRYLDESRQDYKEKDNRRNFKSPQFVSTDPYVILGIARGSSKAEIKAAYFAKAREYHPG